MLISLGHSTEPLTSRFQGISIFAHAASRKEVIGRFMVRYAEYFSPQFLFLKGDSNLRHYTGIGGELVLSLLPVVLAGLWWAIRFARTQPGYRLVLVSLLIYPIPAALTVDHFHSTRCINGILTFTLLGVMGAYHLVRKLHFGRSALILLGLIAVAQTGYYLWDYFGDYQQRARGYLLADFTDAIEAGFQRLGTNETFYLSGSVLPLSVTPEGKLALSVDKQFHPYFYTHLLFFGKIDPRTYQQHGLPSEKVCYYEGTIHRPGLLLRADPLVIKFGNQWMTQPDPEPLPLRAKRLVVLPFTTGAHYELYRIHP